MPIPPDERERFHRQVESLRAIDDAGELSADQARAAIGDVEREPPELELHRRARALGMARTSR